MSYLSRTNGLLPDLPEDNDSHKASNWGESLGVWGRHPKAGDARQRLWRHGEVVLSVELVSSGCRYKLMSLTTSQIA